MSYQLPPLRGPLLAALVALSTTACSGRSDGAANIYTFSEGAFEISEVVGNGTIDRRIDIQDPVSVRREGRLFVQFDLHNRNPRHTHVEYTVEWFDAAGLRVPYIEQWAPLHIGAQSVETVTLTAPTESAVRARFQLRSPAEIQ